MPHWKSLMEKDYIGHWDIEGKGEVTLEITKVEQRKVRDQKKGKEVGKPCVYFRGTEKGLILNDTNGKAIEGLYGPDFDKWVGKRITLIVLDGVPAFGGVSKAIRIKPSIPKDDK